MRNLKVLPDRRWIADDDDAAAFGRVLRIDPDDRRTVLVFGGPGRLAAICDGSAADAGFVSATSGMEVTDTAGLRNGLSRSAIALETANRQSAPRPMAKERAAGMKPAGRSGVLIVLAERAFDVLAYISQAADLRFGGSLESNCRNLSVPAATHSHELLNYAGLAPLLVHHGLFRVRREGRIGLHAAQEVERVVQAARRPSGPAARRRRSPNLRRSPRRP